METFEGRAGLLLGTFVPVFWHPSHKELSRKTQNVIVSVNTLRILTQQIPLSLSWGVNVCDLPFVCVCM